MGMVFQSDDAFWKTVLGRRSIRRYRPDAVPRAMVERLLTAAHWAPSAHNRQPWRFVVITQEEVKERLAEAMAQRWRMDLERDGVEDVEVRLARSRERVTQAPVLILGCVTMKDMDAYPDEVRQEKEWVMATQSLALALGNLMLAAYREGLGSCWMCAPLFAQQEVRDVLRLPTDWEPQALISLGWPAETRRSSRRPLQEVVVWK